MILFYVLGVTVKVYSVDLATETIASPVTVRAYLSQTLAEFRHLVCQTLDVPADNMRFVLEKHYNELKLLTSPEATLKSEGFYKTNKVSGE